MKSHQLVPFDWGDGLRIVYVSSDRIPAGIRFWRDNGLDGIGIARIYGYLDHTVDFLRGVPELNGLVVSDGDFVDICAVESCKNLKILSINRNRQAISYADFKRLQDLRLFWHNKVVLPKDGTGLRRLQLTSYRASDLSNLPVYPDLNRLRIIGSTISSLEGAQRYKRLEDCLFAYCPKLRDASLLAETCLSLKEVEFNHCKRLRDFAFLRECRNIEFLRLLCCGSIESIGFIEDMPKLKRLSFHGTNILDGDLWPCLGLDFVGFENRCHYSHTYNELNAQSKYIG